MGSLQSAEGCFISTEVTPFGESTRLTAPMFSYARSKILGACWPAIGIWWPWRISNEKNADIADSEAILRQIREGMKKSGW